MRACTHARTHARSAALDERHRALTGIAVRGKILWGIRDVLPRDGRRSLVEDRRSGCAGLFAYIPSGGRVGGHQL
jgi:hypothetical protein